MKDMWTALEERTRAWHALDRQGLADAVWADYVAARFARSGDPRALQFLYPYLNHADRGTRMLAVRVAGQVFEGRGPKAVESLDYFTRNTDPFLCDRAVSVIGPALAGWSEGAVMDVLTPYLKHRNQFIQRLAMTALSKAMAGSASETVLAEIQRVAKPSRAAQIKIDHAVSRVFAGRPTEDVYSMVVRPDAGACWRGIDLAVARLVRSASDAWYERACREFFHPRLHVDEQTHEWPQFVQRGAAEGLCIASAGRGVEALQRVLHLRHKRCTMYALLGTSPSSPAGAPACFDGADRDANRGPLLDLIRSGDLPTQRLAAVCLGRLMVGTEDAETLKVLSALSQARNGAVRSAALLGLGQAARSSCNEDLRRLCLDLARQVETAKAAIGALGRIFLGSGRSDVLEDLRHLTETYRDRPRRGRHHYRPLAECYRAVGWVYQGTGSMEPVDFLLDVLVPSPVQWCPYRWAAGRALVMIEFSATTLSRALGEGWS